MEDSGSIEIPVRKPRMEPSQQRPVFELVLGVLDTFHSSTKSELRRIQARQARQAMKIATTTSTTTVPSVSKLLQARVPTLRKRFPIRKL